jgi:oxygen-independent coproporphyrinogen-3 oxidase
MSAFGIYLHWPYCTAICPYCDFNVYRARGGDNAALLNAMKADIAAHATRFGARAVTSIFFGGGTPSLLRGGEIALLIEAIASFYPLASDCEITLEANPEDAALFAEQAAAGINRFSIGVQALDDVSLKALGRAHDAASALCAVDAAAATGQRVSLDLIYARDGQGIEAWRAELTQALALPIEHASLYQLSIEAGTAFARRAARGQLAPPGAELAADFYEVTQELCAVAGFPGYEISNHASSVSARARHNLIYWRGEDWVGIGPGAHGRITHDGARLALEAERRPSAYIDAVAQRGIGWSKDERLSGEQAADELLLMGLRLDEGVAPARIEALRGRPLNRQKLGWLAEQGLLVHSDDRLRLTPRGRALTDAIVTELVR